MYCDNCDAVIDRDVDRHLVRRETFRDPEIGLEDAQGEVLCLKCARPHLRGRTRELAEQLAAPGQ